MVACTKSRLSVFLLYSFQLSMSGCERRLVSSYKYFCVDVQANSACLFNFTDSGRRPSHRFCVYFTEAREILNLPCERSACVITFLLSITSANDGQPQPLSNLVSLENISTPQTMQQYFPSSVSLTYSPEKAL